MKKIKELPIINLHSIVISIFSIVTIVHAAETSNYVTCGSVIKLANEVKNKVRLHSHDIKYGSGSGQQSVTAVENQDTNSYWAILGSLNQQCKRGEPIKCGSNLRLQHLQTRKFLHSHHFKSPLSSQQEVSAFGKDDQSDTGDLWTLHCKGSDWIKGQPVRFKHVDTEVWLSLSGNTYGRPIHGHMEVVGATYPESTSYWQTAEGLFLQPTLKITKPDTNHDEL